MNHLSSAPTTVMITSGGVAPGMNAVIGGGALEGKKQNHRVVGLRNGWNGFIHEQKIIELSAMTDADLMRLFLEPSTILGSSRTKLKPGQYPDIEKVIKSYKFRGGIAIGGDDTLGQASALHAAGVLPMIGVPKTVDNDVQETDLTFGFETAVDVSAWRIRKMHDDARAMHAVAIGKCMGRKAGWITLKAGAMGGADITLIPECPITDDVLLARILSISAERSKEQEGAQGHVVIAIAEGYFGEREGAAKDGFGNGQLEDAAGKLAALVREKLGLKTQEETVGYDCRNGPPTTADAKLGAQYGAYAVALASRDLYGTMVVKRDGRITHVPLSKVGGGKLVPQELYDRERLRMRLVPENIILTMDQCRNELNDATV